MNDMSGDWAARDETSAFRFTGDWREFAPIAFTNLLLTIVTLGVYRFWANGRTRRYLWSRTEFIDDALEWTGTGMEMFLGFLVVAVVIVPVLLFFQFGFEALILRGYAGWAFGAFAAIYIALLYLGGVATFRALRYRLSRTLWHGISGGSAQRGWRYGWSWLWRSVVGFLAGGLLVPWSMTALWNERWGAMSFGPLQFQASARFEKLMGRWVLVLLSPFILLIVGGVIAGVLAAGGMAGGFDPATAGWTVGVAIALFVIGIYALVALIGLGYYAAYFREAVGATSLGDLEFEFTARSKDWLALFFGNLGLAIVTLGIGIIFWSYRNWKFFITHLEAYGEVDPSLLTRSTLTNAGDSEGMAELFDIGAI